MQTLTTRVLVGVAPGPEARAPVRIAGEAVERP